MTGAIELELAMSFALAESREDAVRVGKAQDELARLRANNSDLIVALESLLGAVQASGMDAYGTITEDAEMAIRKSTAP